MYSNARAYQDAGFDAEIIEIAEQSSAYPLPDDLQMPVRFFAVPRDEARLAGRAAYRLGWMTTSAFAYAFPLVRTVLAAVRQLEAESPGALHHFEGEPVASAMPFTGLRAAIWSQHDIPSAIRAATTRIACDLEKREPIPSELREYRFVARAERSMARCAGLILAISDADRRTVSSWGVRQVATLPMSIPYDEAPIRSGPWARDGRLTLLHLGRTAHLPSYRSLEFLLGGVFPALPLEVRARLRLLVAGSSDDDEPRSRHIRELAARFPDETRFLGFVPDLESLYREADMQVVASTDATGLRTRIVESFARGLPVLSTSTAADGVLGLEPGKNILLADDTAALVRVLSDLVGAPTRLSEVARAARLTYERLYAAPVVTERLAELLAGALGIRAPAITY
jgi:glycosyltransferase involved in cell wall biosynthesis